MAFEDINRHLFFPFPHGARTDALMAFGCGLMSRPVAEEMAVQYAALHQAGHSPFVVFTGGKMVANPWLYRAFQAAAFTHKIATPIRGLFNRSANEPLGNATQLNFPTREDGYTKAIEADFMRQAFLDKLEELDIPSPPKDKIILERTSTNTGLNLGYAKKDLEQHNIQTVTAFSLAYLQRRSVETALIRTPDLIVFPYAVYPYGYSRDNWAKGFPRNLIARHFVQPELVKTSSTHPKSCHKSEDNTYEGTMMSAPISEQELETLRQKAIALGAMPAP